MSLFQKKRGGSLQLINIVAFINNPPKNVSVLILLVYIKTFSDDYQLLLDLTDFVESTLEMIMNLKYKIKSRRSIKNKVIIIIGIEHHVGKLFGNTIKMDILTLSAHVD